MNWLLVSGFTNPGDEWARLGIVELIRDVDPEAHLMEIDKFDLVIQKPIDGCDRIVFCGQPLVWAHKNGLCTEIDWWEPLNGWMADTGNLILAGFGLMCPVCSEQLAIDTDYLRIVQEPVQKLIDKARAAWSRNPITNDYFNVEVSPCPSIHAGRWMTPTRELKLCNFMGDGGHEGFQMPWFAEPWNEHSYEIAKILIKENFIFVAHRDSEAPLAIDRGWPERLIYEYDGNPSRLLHLYSRARCYIGNRVHGAIVAASFGADSVLVGQDSRMHAAHLAGARVFTPTFESDRYPSIVDFVEEWSKGPFTNNTHETHIEKQKEFFK